MSTRAIVAMPTGPDPLPAPGSRASGCLGSLFGLRARPAFSGVYHHNGGNPDELGALLWTLVRERYRGEVKRLWSEVITSNAAGWSSLHALSDDAALAAWDGKSKRTAAQAFADEGDDALPVTYQGDPQRDFGFTAPPVHDWNDKMGASFVYVVCRDELVVYLVEEDGVAVREVARVRWDAEAPAWDDRAVTNARSRG